MSARMTGGQQVLGAQQARLCLGCALAGMPLNSREGMQCHLRGALGRGDGARKGILSAGFSWVTHGFQGERVALEWNF